MVEISFKGKIRKVGNSSMVTIPKEYIGHELQRDILYTFKIDTGAEPIQAAQTAPEQKPEDPPALDQVTEDFLNENV